MEEWKEVQMSDIIEEISMGPFGSDIKKEVYTDSGVPVLNGSNLQGFKLGEDSFGYVTEEKANSLKKSIAHRGDIVVTHRGTLGQIIYIPQDSKYDRYLISQSQFRFKLKKDLAIPEYVVYYFHSREGQNRLLSNASQVGVPALARASTTFRLLKIPLPALDVQSKIVSILKSLDDKIENNRKINENLEQQAQALFKSWFVDFEPFRDQPFVESELGMIPEGWRVGVLNELVYFINGYPFKSESFVSKGRYKVITIKSVQDGNLSTNNTSYIDELPLNLKKECILSLGDILLSLTGNVGRCCLVDENNLLLNQRVAKIVPTQISSNSYVYAYFRRMDTQQSLISIARGTAQANLSPIETGNLKVIIPPKQIIDNYSTIVSKLLLNIIELKLENSKLSHLRDTFLPRLMSGELSVK